jgi:hypothetical protein
VLVVAPHELVSSADEQLHVVDFGARLIEALAQVLQAKKDKVDCGRRGDAYDLTFFARRPSRCCRVRASLIFVIGFFLLLMSGGLS